MTEKTAAFSQEGPALESRKFAPTPFGRPAEARFAESCWLPKLKAQPDLRHPRGDKNTRTVRFAGDAEDLLETNTNWKHQENQTPVDVVCCPLLAATGIDTSASVMRELQGGR